MGKIPFSFTLLGFYEYVYIGLFSVVMHTDLNIGNVINRLRMWTISNYMHRVSEGSIFSYVGLKMSTIWLAKDIYNIL